MTKSIKVSVDAASSNSVQVGLGGPVVAPGANLTVTVPYHGIGIAPTGGGPATWTLDNVGADPLDVATTVHAPLAPAGSVAYSAKETVAVG